MDLRSGMSVSDEACRGLRLFSDQECRSPMKHVEVSDWSPIRHVGHRCVSDNNTIFVKSVKSFIFRLIDRVYTPGLIV